MSNDGAIIINPHKTENGSGFQSEVVRSVSFTLNLGNYQNMTFFCSQKAQCQPDEVTQVSTDLYDWCYAQVMESVRDVQAKQAKKQALMEQRRSA